MSDTKKRVQTATIEAEYKFTQEELVELGQHLAAKHQEKASLESSKKNYNSQIKSDQDLVETQITQLSQKLSTGKEFRDFLCNVEMDYESRKKHYISVVTGEIIQTLNMNAYDLQAKMDLDEEGQGEDESIEGEDEEAIEQPAGREQALLPAPAVDADYTIVDEDFPL